MTPEVLIPVDEFEALHDRIRRLEAEVERMGAALGRHHFAMPTGDLDPCVICRREQRAMTDDNVGRERYCPRVDSVPVTWGPGDRPDEHHCAECGAAVVYNPTRGEGPVRLVCIDCLHVLATKA